MTYQARDQPIEFSAPTREQIHERFADHDELARRLESAGLLDAHRRIEAIRYEMETERMDRMLAKLEELDGRGDSAR